MSILAAPELDEGTPATRLGPHIVGLLRTGGSVKKADLVSDLVTMPSGPSYLDWSVQSMTSGVLPTTYYAANTIADDFIQSMYSIVPDWMKTRIDQTLASSPILFQTRSGKTDVYGFEDKVQASLGWALYGRLRYGRPNPEAKALKEQRNMAIWGKKQAPALLRVWEHWGAQTIRGASFTAAIYSHTENPVAAMAIQMYVRPRIEGFVMGRLFAHMTRGAEQGAAAVQRSTPGPDGAPGLRVTPGDWSSMIRPFIKNRTAATMLNLVDGSEKTLRQVMQRSVEQGWSPTQTGEWMSQTYSLTPRMEQALANYRTKLIGDKIPMGKVRQMVRDKALEYDSQRAALFAENEMFTAMNAGRDMMINHAVRNGFVMPSTKKMWVVAPDERVCDVCRPMEGMIVNSLDQYRLPTGEHLTNPPAHVRCRCIIVPFADKKEIRR